MISNEFSVRLQTSSESWKSYVRTSNISSLHTHTFTCVYFAGFLVIHSSCGFQRSVELKMSMNEIWWILRMPLVQNVKTCIFRITKRCEYDAKCKRPTELGMSQNQFLSLKFFINFEVCSMLDAGYHATYALGSYRKNLHKCLRHKKSAL